MVIDIHRTFEDDHGVVHKIDDFDDGSGYGAAIYVEEPVCGDAPGYVRTAVYRVHVRVVTCIACTAVR